MPTDINAEFDTAFSLKINQQAQLPDGTVIRFVRVEEDSRCPQEADCVWEGNAVVAFELIESGVVPRPFTLNTNDSFGNEIVLQGYTISLTSLLPTPSIQLGPLNQADYVAELLVTR